MTNFDDLSNELNGLTQEMRRLTRLMGQSSANRHLRSQERFWRQFDRFMKLPVMEKGMGALSELGDTMKEMNQLSLRSLATGKTLASTISKDLIGASLATGVSMTDLATEIISLREEGFMKVDKSLLTLAGRMKLTGQNTQSLVKFLGANTSVMMLNQREAAKLGMDIAKYAQVYGTRQDDILNLATSLSGKFAGQAQLGYGGQMSQAFANLASVLGGRGTGLVDQLASFYQNATLSQKQLLGFLNGFEESIARERDPEALKNILVQSLTKANASLKSATGNLGPGGLSTDIQKQLLKPFGGESALVIPQLLKALEDAKPPMVDLSKAMVGFNSAAEMFKMPLQLLGIGLNALLNTPIISSLVKGLALFAGVATTFTLGVKVINMAMMSYRSSVRLFNIGVRGFQNAARMNARSFMAGTPLTLGISLLVALLGEFLPSLFGMSQDMDEINKKTPDLQDKSKINSGLTGQIFSQLVNIVTSNSGSVQQEQLALQRELVRLAREQNDRNNPNNSLVTQPIPRKI